jgi:hypothetical protein
MRPGPVAIDMALADGAKLRGSGGGGGGQDEGAPIFEAMPPPTVVIYAAMFWVSAALAMLLAPVAGWRGCLLVLAAGILHLAHLELWRSTRRYCLTPDHLLVESGILAKKGWPVAISDIAEVKYTRSLVGLIGGFGTMILTVRGQAKEIRLPVFPQVELAAKLILDARQRHTYVRRDMKLRVYEARAAIARARLAEIASGVASAAPEVPGAQTLAGKPPVAPNGVAPAKPVSVASRVWGWIKKQSQPPV